jgi:hypothetical protein
MRSIRSAVFALGCWWLTGVTAQQTEREDAGPDLDFLEYLGAWAEEDDEWLAIEEWRKDGDAEPEAAPEPSEKEKEGDDEGE